MYAIGWNSCHMVRKNKEKISDFSTSFVARSAKLIKNHPHIDSETDQRTSWI